METAKQIVMRVLGMDYKGRCVRNVLKAFKAMGASDEDIKREKRRLEEDDMYLAEWHVAVNPPRKIKLGDISA